MNAFATALKVLMRDPNLAEEVVYTPSSGSPKTVRASFSMGDRTVDLGGGDFTGPQITADVNALDVPVPKRGDQLTRADGTVYVVAEHVADSLRLTHRLTLREA